MAVTLLAAGALLAACVSMPRPSPASSAAASVAAPTPACGELEPGLCADVAEAATMMTGTAAVHVEALAVPDDDGLPMTERYLVRLEAEDGVGEQLVEVVRFQGSDGWSVRRLRTDPTD